MSRAPSNRPSRSSRTCSLDADGRVLDAKHAEHRAAQLIRSYLDSAYQIDPPFEDREVALY